MEPPQAPERPSPVVLLLIVFGFLAFVVAIFWFFTSRQASSAYGPISLENGPRLHAAGIRWQARDLSWTEFGGQNAVDMLVVPHRSNNDTQTLMIEPDVLMALCGEFLSKSASMTEIEIVRADIYRLSFQFILKDNETLSEMHPVAVVNGQCRLNTDAGLYYWNYPGKLAGWAPTSLKQRTWDNSEIEFEIRFKRLHKDAVGLDAFDPLLACNAILADTPPNIVEKIGKPTLLGIAASSGVGNRFLNVNRVNSWRMAVSGKTCSYTDDMPI